MQEQRENADLAGLGNAIDAARQDKNMGMNTMLNGAMTFAAGIYDEKTEEKPNASDVLKSTIGMNYPREKIYQPRPFWA